MYNLEKKIKESIEDKTEFYFLNNFNLYCTGKPLNEFYLNICLDTYNKLIDKQMKYFAKYNSLRLTCLHIASKEGIKVK